MEFAQKQGFINKKINILGIPDKFIEHGSTGEIFEELGLDEKGLELYLEQIVSLK